MWKKWLSLLVLCSTITIALASCGGDRSGSSASGNVNEAHLSMLQTTITIQKGESLTLINDHFTPHILANGTWEHGTAKPAREAGAPMVKDMRIESRSSAIIGPFTAIGTFQFYCTIHGGMNLIVVVQ